jgi:hypothetical protein
MSEAASPLLSAHPLADGLSEILMRASSLGADRRRVRYQRLRKAVNDGLEDGKVLKVKRAKRNKAVDPSLPEEMVKRMGKKSVTS